MSDEGLQATGVSFAYHVREAVLREITLTIPRGGLWGILGPNGSGKTTLLRLLSGLASPKAGSVSIDGDDLRRMPRKTIARRLAIVPQETQLAFDYTVLEMAMMGRYPHLGAFEIEGPRDLSLARQALEATGTLPLESRMFNTLSGGEKQRVVIASALAQFNAPAERSEATEALLLDEPTASLDLTYQLEIRAILERLNRERGLTIIVSTHDLNLASSLCRDLVLLERGRVLAAGEASSMLQPALIRQLYGVDVQISRHPTSGYPMVVPLGRVSRQAPPS